MKYTVLLFAALTVCQAARYYPPTTTTTQPPKTTTHAPSRSTTQDVETFYLPGDSSVCPDITNTINPLGRLRAAMKNFTLTQWTSAIDAYIIFYSDEHLSEEPSAEERRLEYISGWRSAGVGVVLKEGGAAIWVSSGDLTRARSTLSCAWTVFDADSLSEPSIVEWISSKVTRSGYVGTDMRLVSFGEWQNLQNLLQEENLQLINLENLVDILWRNDPNPSSRLPQSSPIVAYLHKSEYTGLSRNEKINLLRSELKSMSADGMVVTALDEVAWLLNIRGKDVPYAPLLKAFVYVSFTEVRMYIQEGKLVQPVVRDALNVCYPPAIARLNNNCTSLREYNLIYVDLRNVTANKILIPTRGTFQGGANAAIAQSVPVKKRYLQASPIVYMKAQKNKAEIEGMRKAHLRDAVAMCTLLSYIEGMVSSGMSEMSIVNKVDMTRGTQAGYVGLSMQTKIAFGPSGAEPDYTATNRTNRRVFRNSTLIIQSGGQYEEGTTVLTRTLHYGFPTTEERRAYTTVLRSMAALATLHPPSTLPAAHADPIARAPLWSYMQDYPHPTGYGVGAALNRREEPVVIDYRQDTNLHPFREGYFITSEPAWYESDKFGVRLGNVLEVIARSSSHLGFTEVTLVPFEPKLIDATMLTEYEIKWLNDYNKRIRETVGKELKAQGLTDVYSWMEKKTLWIQPSKKKCTSSATQLLAKESNIVYAILPLTLLMVYVSLN